MPTPDELSENETDHNGRPIPAGETPDTKIFWWEVDPHPDHQYTTLAVRSWQQMLDYMRYGVETVLDAKDEDELREGVTFTYRLVQGTLGQYQEICDAEP